MAAPATAQPSKRTGRQFAAYDIPALLVLLALTGLTFLSVTRPEFLALTRSAVLDVAITVTALIIALVAAYFTLSEFLLYGPVTALCVGVAFVVFIGTAVGLGLVPLLPGVHVPLSDVPYGLATQRVINGSLFVAAAFLVGRSVPVLRRPRLVWTGVGSALILCALLMASAYAAGAGEVSQSAERALQVIAGILYFISSALFWRASRLMSRAWFFWLAFSLCIAGFAQLEYAIKEYPVGVVQRGDVLRLLFFVGILFALLAEWSINYRRLRWQARELGALHALMTAPIIEDVGAVVQHIVRVVSETLHVDARLLVAPESNGDMGTGGVPQMHQVQASGSLSVSGSPEDEMPTSYEVGEQNQVVLSVPLRTAERHLATLLVVRQAGDEFSAHDVRLLRAFGAQASVLLERSLLYEEVAAGAVIDERSRLAREIHDGLAQHLAFLKMRVSWLQRSTGAIEAEQLADIERVLETALVEARHAITTLRADPQGTGTLDVIAGYAEEFGQVSDLQVEVRFEEPVPDIGPKARVELLRIVQEALNNVRKHAGATRVCVDIRPRPGGVEIQIADNGAGFEIGRTARGHFGLEIMRERAESTGGRLEVSSSPGSGTTLRIWAPIHEAERSLRDVNPLGLARL